MSNLSAPKSKNYDFNPYCTVGLARVNHWAGLLLNSTQPNLEPGTNLARATTGCHTITGPAPSAINAALASHDCVELYPRTYHEQVVAPSGKSSFIIRKAS